MLGFFKCGGVFVHDDNMISYRRKMSFGSGPLLNFQSGNCTLLQVVFLLNTKRCVKKNRGSIVMSVDEVVSQVHARLSMKMGLNSPNTDFKILFSMQLADGEYVMSLGLNPYM
jgi:hypothetical protein